MALMIEGSHDDADREINGQGNLGAELVHRPVLPLADAVGLGLMERIDVIRASATLGQDLGHGAEGFLMDLQAFGRQLALHIPQERPGDGLQATLGPTCLLAGTGKIGCL